MTAPHSSPWLRDGEVLLHIGVHKTGTTAIQTALAASRERLREHGVTYPGSSGSHNWAAQAAIGKPRLSVRRPDKTTPATRRWNQLAREVRAAGGRVILSGEAFCQADGEDAARIVDKLGRDRVRVVMTLRPLEELLPSTWQQYVKTGKSHRYEYWLDDILRGPQQSRVTPSFWRRNDHGALVERWAGVVGADRVAVIIVGSTDHDRIYRDFEQLIGLTPGTLAAQAGIPSNRSMSAPEIELIRRLNEALRESPTPALRNRLVRKGAARAVIDGRRPGPDEARIVLPSSAVTAARTYGRDAVARIRRQNVEVLGELDDLVPDTPVVPADVADPDTIPIDAAELALEGMYHAAVAQIERPSASESDVEEP